MFSFLSKDRRTQLFISYMISININPHTCSNPERTDGSAADNSNPWKNSSNTFTFLTALLFFFLFFYLSIQTDAFDAALI